MIMIIILANIIIVLLHFLFSTNLIFIIGAPFNLPAFYLFLKFIILAALFLIFWWRQKKQTWLYLALLFVYLGFDTLFNLHDWLSLTLFRQPLMSLYWCLIYFLPIVITITILIFLYQLKIKQNKGYLTSGQAPNHYSATSLMTVGHEPRTGKVLYPFVASARSEKKNKFFFISRSLGNKLASHYLFEGVIGLVLATILIPLQDVTWLSPFLYQPFYVLSFTLMLLSQTFLILSFWQSQKIS
jgi:hypothetical protein